MEGIREALEVWEEAGPGSPGARACSLLFRFLGLHRFMVEHPHEWKREGVKKREYYELLSVIAEYIARGIEASEKGGGK